MWHVNAAREKAKMAKYVAGVPIGDIKQSNVTAETDLNISELIHNLTSSSAQKAKKIGRMDKNVIERDPAGWAARVSYAWHRKMWSLRKTTQNSYEN